MRIALTLSPTPRLSLDLAWDDMSLGFADSDVVTIAMAPWVNGSDGKSAYEIAVENGFSGTEAQWLASLEGPPGTTDYNGLANVPSSFPPSAHTHSQYVNKAGDQMTGQLDAIASNTPLKLTSTQDYKDAVQVIGNPDFTNSSLWTLAGGWAISGGKLVNAAGTTGNISIGLTGLTSGASYVIEVGVDSGTVYFQPSSDAGATKRSYWRSWEGNQLGFVAPSANFTFTLSQDYVTAGATIDYIRMYKVVTNAQRMMQGVSVTATTFDLVASGTSFGLGAQSLNNAGNAQGSVAIGRLALNKAVRPYNAIAIGDEAMGNSQGPSECIGIGRYALRNVSVGFQNVVVGNESGQSINAGYNNTHLGNYNGIAITSGNGNVVIGYNAFNSVTSGYENVIIGQLSGHAFNGSSSQNVTVGARVLLSGTPGAYSSFTAIGWGAGANNPYTGSTCLGASSSVTGGNQVQLGASGTTTYAYGAVQDRSDRRDKRAIQPTELGLSFIMQLNPVDFKWDLRDDYKVEVPESLIKEKYQLEELILHIEPGSELTSLQSKLGAINQSIEAINTANLLGSISSTGSKTRNRFHHGFIAQDVRNIIQSTGKDFGGFQNHKLNGGDDVLSLGYSEFIAPMVKAIQEQQAQIESLKAQVLALTNV